MAEINPVLPAPIDADPNCDEEIKHGIACDDMFRRSDPVYNFIRYTTHVGPIIGYLLFGLIPFITETIYCSLAGCLVAEPPTIGLWQDYSNFVNLALLFPTLFAFYLWIPRAITSSFAALRKNKVIPPFQSLEYAPLYERIHKLFSHWLWFLAALVITLLLEFVLVVPYTRNFNNWWSQVDFFFIGHQVYFIVIMYSMVYLILRILQFILALRWMFKTITVDLKALHPDGCGGLRTLGDFSMKLGYGIGIIGFSIVVLFFQVNVNLGGELWQIDWSIPIITVFVAYLLFAPVVFFAPLSTAHEAMRKAKEEELLIISQHFEKNYKNILVELPTLQGRLKEGIDTIKQMQELYDVVARFPVWPYNNRNLVRFFSSVGTPVLITLISTLINWIIR